ncbi:MAG: adenosylcobinamide-phosphate synthase CbiB [Paracoccus sp. (in: a-proteobacteria)]|uniref:adenosylcobinamide-phosphate synthase CbiB n=1 Tax=Paracoccus sp. TaxID=267 RepID=UPI0026E010FA|nr:adenosylcobinamide-phosphate synthase CbiB [Paracoccus sp. (in: a-proteobacteria)]MDO5631568.1 adenosylcobinamide-phosphate synthase CbiB [Paracoccus sp. (in: a-proteobacteria)]
MTALLTVCAMALDALIGWPDALFRRIGHPVTWLGGLISLLDRRMNRGRARVARGTLASLLVIAAATLPACILVWLLGPWSVLLGWPLIASRSLWDHVAAVARPLVAGDLPGARQATAMIVGRDVTTADAPALSRAALESLAENASDGVVAPVFWLAVAGLPGIAAYKAINTLDSMIGHRTPRHEAFGKFAARLDDAANWPAARLSALLIALAAGWRRGRAALACARTDARHHRSPNAGWPESAMAGALNVRLSGPRVYADRIADEPWLNAAAPDPDARDLWRGLRLYRRAMGVLAIMLTLTAVAQGIFQG